MLSWAGWFCWTLWKVIDFRWCYYKWMERFRCLSEGQLVVSFFFFLLLKLIGGMSNVEDKTCCLPLLIFHCMIIFFLHGLLGDLNWSSCYDDIEHCPWNELMKLWSKSWGLIFVSCDRIITNASLLRLLTCIHLSRLFWKYCGMNSWSYSSASNTLSCLKYGKCHAHIS